MEGLHAVWRQPILRGMVVAGLAQNLAFGLVGTVFLLYVNQEVGFDPGILGMIFAVGGVSSFLGAMIAGRLPRFGIGAVMVASLLLAAIGEAFIPLATAANAIGVLFLVGQQIVADSALTVYDINQVSLRQAIAPAHVLGRVNASVRVTEFGAVLLGTIIAGYIGETVGLRETLWLGVGLSLLAAVALALSPVPASAAHPGDGGRGPVMSGQRRYLRPDSSGGSGGRTAGEVRASGRRADRAVCRVARRRRTPHAGLRHRASCTRLRGRNRRLPAHTRYSEFRVRVLPAPAQASWHVRVFHGGVIAQGALGA